ncbi:MAG: glycosyltransferase [Deltaproteobacteria bacterium]|nr:glycosyltransferase [Deltaproteobacteria bacterium]MBW2183555.1 glycosyltransferase [Deltaproteobacteria bacterium]
MRPLVTIIIPVRNEEETIGKCLHSLKALNYPNYEIIVVNDGSTDRTEKILKQFNTITIITTEGVGPSIARNLAIEKSKGEYLAFTDGDCLIDKEWLNELLTYFTDTNIMGIGGDQLQPEDETSFGKDVYDFFNLIAFSTDYLKTKKEVMNIRHNPTCNMMYRKAAFEKIGNFKKDLWPCEDLEFDCRLIQSGYRLIFNPKAIVYHYRPKNLKKYGQFHFRYGRAHAKLVLKYGFTEKIHYIPPLLLSLCMLEILLLLYNLPVAVITFCCFMIVPLFYFLLKGKGLLKAFQYHGMFLTTIITWTTGFIRGLADKNIWQ